MMEEWAWKLLGLQLIVIGCLMLRRAYLRWKMQQWLKSPEFAEMQKRADEAIKFHYKHGHWPDEEPHG